MKNTLIFIFIVAVAFSQTLHKFRITPVYDPSTPAAVRTALQFAIDFYTPYIQVKQASTSTVTYNPTKSQECSNLIPSTYSTSGFDPTTTDILIIVRSQSYNAQLEGIVGVACRQSLVQWPTYGVIVHNQATYSFTTQTDLNKIMLHQLAHVLGLSYSFRDVFPAGYLQTIQVESQQRQMIASSKVVSYINNFFDCFDRTTGALLSNQNVNQFEQMHFDSSVYDKQLLNGGTNYANLEMSPLTLLAIEDLNFYDQISFAIISQPSSAVGQGCSFALGIKINPAIESKISSSSDLGLILGLTIPLSILLLIIFLLIMACVYYFKNKAQNQKMSVTEQTQKHQGNIPDSQKIIMFEN